jgi:hypothetical protein
MNGHSTTVGRIGALAAVLGATAGVIELAVGSTQWTGNKNDPTTLGMVGLGLAAVIGVAALAWSRATTTGRALAVTAAMALPAAVGLTTAGAVWIPAALVGVFAGWRALEYTKALGSVAQTLSESWSAILLGVLALIYLAFGVVSRNTVGLLGVAGAVAVVAALTVRRRSRILATVILVGGTLPFAAATLWTVVIPLTAVLLLAIGLPLLFGGNRAHRVMSR